MIGFDTAALIDLFKNDKSLVELITKIEDKVVLTRISYLELMFGIDQDNSKHLEEEKYFDSLFEEFNVLELDKEASKKASRISWNLQKEGKTIEPFDCAIAGILVANGVKKILTRNVKHFENIKELEVIGY